MIIKVTDMTAFDAFGIRTVDGLINGEPYRVTGEVKYLDTLTYDEATNWFIEKFKDQLRQQPRVFELKQTSIDIEI